MIKAFVQAARPKTLALALAGPIVAAALASIIFSWDKSVFMWQVLTTVGLQVLSNFDNDYGDFAKGTDQAANRSDRALASGAISHETMKKALYVVTAFTLIAGIMLLRSSLNGGQFVAFFVLGIMAIAAAINYTVGKKAYGYHKLGDAFVFVFFGWVSVAGGFYLHTYSLTIESALLSTAFGFLAMAVLNINNIRDIDTDLLSNKKTMANSMGKQKAISYQRFLLMGAWLLNVLALVMRQIAIWGGHKPEFSQLALVPVVFLPFLLMYMFHLSALKAATVQQDYNIQLRNVSLLCLSLAIYWVMLGKLLFI